MKVDILTRHSVPNYGSLLQTYATQKTIEKLGYETEVINYTRYEERYNKLANTLIKGKKWDKNIFLRALYIIIQSFNFAKMYKKFLKYRKKFLKETKAEYGNIMELEENTPKADVYCSGSDQIWGKIGTVNYDRVYFLDFVKNGKCISYASSFGKEKLDKELNKNLKTLLNKYSTILVREKSAKEILLNEDFQNVEQVLDPTFLVERENWEKIADETKKKQKQKYVLVYQLHANKEFNKYAKKFAKKKNLTLIRIGYSIYHIFRSGKFKYLPTPNEFLSYIENAEYVLTDSFHATVFSIIFNKKFIVVLPENKTGTRIESILELMKIKNRILKDYEDYELIEDNINYEIVNEQLFIQRKKSIKMLKQAIEN